MNGLIDHPEETHNEDFFRIIRAIHLLSWSDRLDEISFQAVQEWTEFSHTKTLRLSLWCVDNGYITSRGEDSRPESRRFKLTKKGRDKVRRQ